MKIRPIIPAILAVFALAGCVDSYRTLPPEQQPFQAVHEVTLPKDRVYLAAQTWFAQNLGKSKEALQIQDKEAGLLVGKIILPGALHDAMGIVSYPMKLSVKIEAKDNKYRATYEDFILMAGGPVGDREVIVGREHTEAKAAAAKLDAEILAAIKGGAAAKDF